MSFFNRNKNNNTPPGNGSATQVQFVTLADGRIIKYDPAVLSTANGSYDNIWEMLDTLGVSQTLETLNISND
jgi:hypothetical protein